LTQFECPRPVKTFSQVTAWLSRPDFPPKTRFSSVSVLHLSCIIVSSHTPRRVRTNIQPKNRRQQRSNQQVEKILIDAGKNGATHFFF
jgi:hypothetical protein